MTTTTNQSGDARAYEPTARLRLIAERLAADGRVLCYSVDEIEGDGGALCVPTVDEAAAETKADTQRVERLIEALEPVIGRTRLDELETAVSSAEASLRIEAVARLTAVASSLEWGDAEMFFLKPTIGHEARARYDRARDLAERRRARHLNPARCARCGLRENAPLRLRVRLVMLSIAGALVGGFLLGRRLRR